MMRTLIALLATAAMTLPAATQQTDTREGSRQHNSSRGQDASGNRADRSMGQAKDRNEAGRRAIYREYDRNRRGRRYEGARAEDRTRTSYSEESRRGNSRQRTEGRQSRETQGDRSPRSARNRSGGQTQAEPRSNTR